MISESNEDAYSLMFIKYKPLIEKIASSYYTKYKRLGIEKDDLIQEGMMGLVSAIHDYSDRSSLFFTFAIVVVKREMERYIKATTRNKHLILTFADSFCERIGNDDFFVEDVLYNEKDKVEYQNYDAYSCMSLYIFKYELTDFQSQVYELRINNFSNKEISSLLDVNYKSVDNCLRIIKDKLKKYVQKNL